MLDELQLDNFIKENWMYLNKLTFHNQPICSP